MGIKDLDGQSAGYLKITLESNLRRFKGRNPKTLSSVDKDTIIACMSVIIDASAKGIRPSPSLIATVSEIGSSFSWGMTNPVV